MAINLEFIKNFISHRRESDAKSNPFVCLLIRSLKNTEIMEQGTIGIKQEDSSSELVGNINSMSGGVEHKFLIELEKLMKKYQIQKVDISWQKKF